MATCNFIRETRQNLSAMQAVIRYVSQESKTTDEDGKQYLSGIHCGGQTACSEFLLTKHRFGKTTGVWFAHYTQSFSPGENITPAEAHAIGRELAERFFPGYEVLVATHLDAFDDLGNRRIHNHLVVNSVGFTDGKKLHTDRHTLERMRELSDKICALHGLSVLHPYVQSSAPKTVGTREYHAAIKGGGWKFQAISIIEETMKIAGTREEFCTRMRSLGYTVAWSDTRKHITYTCPNGKKVRDIKLHETKFEKENMEHEFRIREQFQSGTNTTDGQRDRPSQSGNAGNGSSRGGDSLSANGLRNPERGLGSISTRTAGSADLSADALQTDQRTGNAGRIRRDTGSGLGCVQESGERCGEEDRRGNRTDSEADARDARSTRTGWEKERADYLRYRTLGAAQLQGSYRSGAIGQALDHRRSGGVGGSIGAGRSARVPLVALTTARLLAGLQTTAKAEEPVEDCTTMDMPKENRHRREREQSM